MLFFSYQFVSQIRCSIYATTKEHNSGSDVEEIASHEASSNVSQISQEEDEIPTFSSSKSAFLYSSFEWQKEQPTHQEVETNETFEETPRKKIKISTPSVKSQMDSITKNSSDELDLLFIKWMIENNITFDKVNSVYLRTFMSKIRPSYKFPDEETFKTTILSRTYELTLNTVRKKRQQGFSLILHRDDERIITAHLKPMFKPTIFLQTIDASVNEEEDITPILEELMQSSMLKFNGLIVSVVEDFLTAVQIEKLLLKNFHIKCHNKTIQDLWSNVTDVELKVEVCEVLKAFDVALLEENSDSNYTVEFMAYQYYIDNLTKLKESAIDDSNNIDERFVKSFTTKNST